MLRILQSVLRGLRAAVAALAESVASLLSGILGGATRPPMLEPPRSPANPVAENMIQLQRNARRVLRWAADCTLRGRAQAPSELPPAVKLWMDGLSRDEIEKLVIAGLPGIKAHLSGACPIPDVMPIGGSLRRELQHEPAADDIRLEPSGEYVFPPLTTSAWRS